MSCCSCGSCECYNQGVADTEEKMWEAEANKTIEDHLSESPELTRFIWSIRGGHKGQECWCNIIGEEPHSAACSSFRSHFQQNPYKGW